MQKNIILIAAISKNRALGYKNELLYHLPNDMKHFRELTTGHTIIMGRKTFESFPKGALPNRRNIVITRQNNLSYPNVEIFHSIEDAINNITDNTIYIIGGGEIYNQTLKYANRLELTVVDNIPENADTFFPEWKNDEAWDITYAEMCNKDEKHLYDYCFETWEKI